MKPQEKLISVSAHGYKILCKSEKILGLFRKLLENSPEISREILSDGRGGHCELVRFQGKEYIFKLDKRDRHRFDYLVQSFFTGSNAFRLMRTLHRAFQCGFRGATELFLVADKRRMGCTLHSYYIMEYITGRDLMNEPPTVYKKYSPQANTIIETLHRFGCVHGDAHRANFILEENTGILRAIDIGGKCPTAPQKATDRLYLEQEWGIENKIFDWGWYFAKFHRQWRHFHLSSLFRHKTQ